MTVSIIILSYNTKDLLLECLESIYANLSDLSFEVIIADNNSTDDSAAAVKKAFPKVSIIENQENLGFAKGINAAVKKVRGEYLFFLNSDAELLDDHLKDMLTLFEQDSTIGIVGGQLVGKPGRTSLSYGNFYTLTDIAAMLFVNRKTGKRAYDKPYKVDWVSGGFMLIRRDVFDRLGGFDEHFFMYIEDMELCYRAKMLKYTVYYYPGAKAKHLGQGSSNRSFAIVQIYKGIMYFYKKHRSMPEYLIVKFMLTIKAYSAILIGVLTGNTYLTKTYRKAIEF